MSLVGGILYTAPRRGVRWLLTNYNIAIESKI